MVYADRLRASLAMAKAELEIRNEQLVRCLANEGQTKEEVQRLLESDLIDWTVLDEPAPYSWH